jgi:uroporphyrinogen decarboxylase
MSAEPTDSGAPICEHTRNAIAGNNKEHDILLRTARGEIAARPAVWLKRQAGRYLPEFLEYSTKVDFRTRSETPDIAIKLSLQPWHKFGTDGVIMFSDICTPFPTFGIDWDIQKGFGPKVLTQIDSVADMDNLKTPTTEDFEKELPFIREILERLRKETEGATTLIGFVGAPWTLAAHVLEGGKIKDGAKKTEELMRDEPEAMGRFLKKFADGIARYAAYQVSAGAQVIQLFESWAHHMPPETFEKFGKPFAKLCIESIKEMCPDTPVIYFANGGTSYLHLLDDMGYDMLDIDSGVDMDKIREAVGMDKAMSGNVEIEILRTGSEADVKNAVIDCVKKARGVPHIVNVGNGVSKDVPLSNVAAFIEQVRELQYSSL